MKKIMNILPLLLCLPWAIQGQSHEIVKLDDIEHFFLEKHSVWVDEASTEEVGKANLYLRFATYLPNRESFLVFISDYCVAKGCDYVYFKWNGEQFEYQYNSYSGFLFQSPGTLSIRLQPIIYKDRIALKYLAQEKDCHDIEFILVPPDTHALTQ